MVATQYDITHCQLVLYFLLCCGLAFRRDGPHVVPLFEKKSGSLVLKTGMADTFISSAKHYLHPTLGCLAVVCDATEIGIIQSILQRVPVPLKLHHQLYFGLLERRTPADKEVQAVSYFEVMELYYPVSFMISNFIYYMYIKF